LVGLTGACSSDSGGGRPATEETGDPATGDGDQGDDGDGDGAPMGDGDAPPGDGDGTDTGDGDGDDLPPPDPGPDDPTDTPVGEDTVPVNEGDPLTPAANTWTWIPIDGTFCRNGQGTGLGINVNPSSDKLVIFLEGGGACFTGGTCLSNPSSYPSAGFDGRGPDSPVLTRDDLNPFADWNLVYLPYCSGDLFTGTNMSGYQGQPQVGYTNITRYLERLVPTFKDKVSEVVLAGRSAGGFGAAFNWMRVQDAFGAIPVHAFDDSAPPMGPEYLTPCLQKATGSLWGWKPAIHPACKDCDPENGNVARPLFETTLNRQKGKRFALLSNDEDGTIKSFFAYGLENCKNIDAFLPPTFPYGKYPQGLDDLRARLSAFEDAAMYEIVGGSHVLLTGPAAWNNTKVGDVTLLSWTTWFRDGDAKWGNVQP
jgi:hypothetical protein